MMKRKSPIVGVITAILIIVISYFAYREYIVPMYQNNLSQTVHVNLKNTAKIALKKKPEQENIFGLEIEINGYTQENIGISLSDGDYSIHQVKLKKGEIDFVYKNDWYTDSLFLNFDLDSNENGTLEIAYRFLGL